LKTDSINQGAFSNKWIFRIETIVFFVLTVFFAYPYFGYRSFFRQSLLTFSISITSGVYSQLRTIAYISTLGFGIFLILVFITNIKKDKCSKEIAATNCAWLAFVLQASAGLSLQWTPYDVWIPQNNTLPVLFAMTNIFLFTSLLLLIKNKWTQRLGYLFSWGSFFFNLVLLIIMLRFFSLFTSFPTLTVIMITNSSLAIYSLHNLHSNTVKKNNIYHQKFSHDFKRFFSSKILAVILLSILILETISFVQPTNYALSTGTPAKEFYVGVTFGGNTATEAKILIDEVKNYTNIFVIDSLPISQNEAELNEICNYAVQNGLHIIVYFAWFSQYWHANWIDTAKQRWGEKFLGLYLYDEPGGVQLDSNGIKYGRVGPTPINQSQAASRYLRSFQTANRGKSDMQMLKMRNIQAFTSDYALYWYDYKAGYDVIFAELGLNSLNNNTQLRQMTAEFVRGAATVQNKDWGAIITWTYNSAPYIESGQDLYNDMKLAYNYGAKYVLVFNYPYESNSTYGILKPEHLDALRNFWNYTISNSPDSSSSIGREAFVLPKDYGYGFRGPNDTNWGFWGGDSFSDQLTTTLYNLMNQFGPSLDIIYNDQINLQTSAYNEFIFWNGTITKTLT
jgi:hypothetical protein